MQNLKSSEKSKGVIVFAFNTDVDYVGIADSTSQLIDHNLKLPVTLVTDFDSQPKFAYDSIIRINIDSGNFRTNLKDEKVNWRNFGRYLAYELSPYDETLLVDTDYLVLDDSLLKLFDTPFDYRLVHHNKNTDGAVYEQMGETSLPFVWATVVLFRKSERARLFFNLVGRVQRNYRYYRNLYNIREGNYRNDYAFAIANIIINGYSLNESQGIPWTMFTIDKPIERMVSTEHNIRIYHADSAVVAPHQCIHVMDKQYLQSQDFKQFVNALTQ
jgi:hypothetical protein